MTTHSFASSMKRAMLAAALVSVFVTSAVSAETSQVPREWPVSSLTYAPASIASYKAATASDGRDFLVVWSDLRNPAYVQRIYARRVTASGEILDPLGIRIPTLTSWARLTNVLFVGTSYLVCWEEAQTQSSRALLAVRIGRDGTILDAAPHVIAQGADMPPITAGTLQSCSAATNGNRTVIIYSGPGGSLMSVVLDGDANVLQRPSLFLTRTDDLSENARIASNGRGFLAIRTVGYQTSVVTLDANGTRTSVVTRPWRAQPGDGPVLDLASDGDGYLAIIGFHLSASSQHYSAAGEPLEAWPITFRDAESALAFVSGSYLFVDVDPLQMTVGVWRLSRAGKPIGSYVPLLAPPILNSYASAAIASNGVDAFVTWIDTQFREGATIDGQTLALSSRMEPLATAATWQRRPDAAFSGLDTAIIWSENNGLYAGRITSTGQLLDGRGIRVAGSDAHDARIVFDGQNYIVGWLERQPPAANKHADVLKLARYTPALVYTGGATAGTNQCGYDFWFPPGALTLAPGNPSTLISWIDCGRVKARTVGRDLLLGPAVTVSSEEPPRALSAAWNGRQWLLAWSDSKYIGQNYPSLTGIYAFRVVAQRVSPSGNLLDKAPLVLSRTVIAVEGSAYPLVASDGEGFLVAWDLAVTWAPPGFETNHPEVRARRVAADGSLSPEEDGVRIAAANLKSIAWDGEQYAVAVTPYAPPHTVNLIRISARGPIRVSPPMTVGQPPVPYDGSARDATIIPGLGGLFVAYTRIVWEPEYGEVERIFITAPYLRRGHAGAR